MDLDQPCWLIVDLFLTLDERKPMVHISCSGLKIFYQQPMPLVPVSDKECPERETQLLLRFAPGGLCRDPHKERSSQDQHWPKICSLLSLSTWGIHTLIPYSMPQKPLQELQAFLGVASSVLQLLLYLPLVKTDSSKRIDLTDTGLQDFYM